MMFLAVLLVPFIWGAWNNINEPWGQRVPLLFSLMVIALVLVAYFYGKTKGRVSAIASAKAVAISASKATSNAGAVATNQIVINVAESARVTAERELGLAGASWIDRDTPKIDYAADHLIEFSDYSGESADDFSMLMQEREE